MNYGNRVHQPWCLAGAKDYRDYLIRTSDEPLDSIQLYLNRLVIVMPEDGSLPPREETEWRLISEPWIGESVTP